MGKERYEQTLSRALKTQLAAEDRPREKAKEKGFESLSTAELLAIIIGSGTPGESVVELCQRILRDHNNKLYLVARNGIKDLMRYKGIGEVKAIEVLAALELSRRYQLEKFEEDSLVRESRDAYQYLRQRLEHLEHEEIWILLLNRGRRIMGSYRISSGGTAMAVGDVKIILRTALEHLADAMILAHNHPSDTLQPSPQDDSLTRQVKAGCDAVGIALLDHIIVCRGGNYYSYADNTRL